MAFPGTRRSTDLNSFYASTIEKWIGGGMVEETVFKANQLIWILSRVAKEVGQYGRDIIQPLMTTKNTGVGWFEYDDTLSIASMDGPDAVRFSPAFLGGPISITEQEEIENAEPHRMVHRLKFKFDQLILSMAEEVNLFGFKGNKVNTKAINGLEDIVFFGAPTSNATDRNMTRTQAQSGIDNTYGTVLRNGTTGWENYAYDLNSTGVTAGEETFKVVTAATANSEAFEVFELAYVFASQGAVRPNLIVSSLRPYLDYQRMATVMAQYNKEIDQFRGINLGNDNTKFRNAVWIYDESAVSHTDAGGDATAAGNHMLYLLNVDYLKLVVESGYDFVQTPFQTPSDARISIGHILWRGQIIGTNPRYLGVLGNYGV